MSDKPKKEVGYCILSGAETSYRLPNGDFIIEQYALEMRKNGQLDENMEFTDKWFAENPHLRKEIDANGHIQAINESI